MSTPESLRTRPRSAAPASESAHRRPPGLVLLFLCAAGFMTFLDVSIVNVALPTIEAQLHISQNYLQYVVTAYATVLGGFLLLSGRLADTFGRRRLLRIGLLVFAGASFLAGVSHAAAILVAARALQGLGSAFIAPAALSLLTNTFPEGPERNKALGAWGAVSGIASVAGVILGGVFTEGPGWRWIFFVNVPIGIVLAAIASVVVGESKATERRTSFDTTGAVFLTGGLVLLIFTLGETFDHGWTSARTLISLGVTVVLLGTFLLIEKRAKEPLIPLGIFRRPVLRSANLVAILLFGTLVTLFFFASLFMQQVLNYSPIRAGLSYIPLAIIVSVGAGVASKLVTKMSPKPVLLIGLTLAALGMLLLWRLPSDAGYLTRVLPPFLIVGLGLGLTFVPVQVISFAGVSKSESGLAAGLINTSQEAGGALGVAVAATIAFSQVHKLERWAHGDPTLMTIARTTVFHRAFLVGACFAVVGILMALLLPKIKAPENPPVPA